MTPTVEQLDRLRRAVDAVNELAASINQIEEGT